jgi:hypothetical protein
MANPIADLKYPDLFAALGKFIEDKKLENVCVMEYEDGVIISGYVVYESHSILRRAQETFVLPMEELKRMMGTNLSSTPKRGLFGR